MFNALLQILDDGRLTDGQGRTVDFRNTVIIMTTNVGTSTSASNALGFAPRRRDADARGPARSSSWRSCEQAFRPEFLNRIDEIIVFDPLTEEQLAQIVELLLAHLRRQVEAQGMSSRSPRAAEEWLGRAGLRPEYGARPLRRAIQRHVENPLSSALLPASSRRATPSGWTVADGGLVFAQDVV